MSTQSSNTYSKPEPVRLLGAITTGLVVFFGGLTTIAGLQDNKTVALIAGVGMLVTAAVNAAKDEFVRKNVVPAIDTAAYRNTSGVIVAGPAAAVAEGTAAVVTDKSLGDTVNVSTQDLVAAVEKAAGKAAYRPSGIASNTKLGEDDVFLDSEAKGNL